MVEASGNRGGTFRLTLFTENLRNPPASDVATFVADFTTLFTISRLAADARYAGFVFPQTFGNRRTSPLRLDDQLRIERLRIESPLQLVASIATSPGTLEALYLLLSGVTFVVSQLPPNWPALVAGATAVHSVSRNITDRAKAIAETREKWAAADKLNAETEAIRARGPAEVGKLTAEEQRILAEAQAIQLRMQLDSRQADATYEMTQLQSAKLRAEVEGISLDNDKKRREMAEEISPLVHRLEHAGQTVLSQPLTISHHHPRPAIFESIDSDTDELLVRRGAAEAYYKVVRQLKNSPIQIAEVRAEIALGDKQQ